MPTYGWNLLTVERNLAENKTKTIFSNTQTSKLILRQDLMSIKRLFILLFVFRISWKPLDISCEMKTMFLTNVFMWNKLNKTKKTDTMILLASFYMENR